MRHHAHVPPMCDTTELLQPRLQQKWQQEKCYTPSQGPLEGAIASKTIEH